MIRRNYQKGECGDETDGDVRVSKSGYNRSAWDTFGFCTLVFATGTRGATCGGGGRRRVSGNLHFDYCKCSSGFFVFGKVLGDL